MIGRIVEVADDRRHLSLSRGFLVVHESDGDRREIGQVPIDDVGALIANAHGLTYTNSLLVALSERGTPFVLCAANHNVVGMLMPVDGNYRQAKRFDAQLAAPLPTRKRLWAQLVKAKLAQQASVLEASGAASAPLSALVKRVRTGDPENVEAQGARRYWSLLFGETFRRDRSEEGVNSLLNYGYTVLRACTARAVAAAGMHPTLGLHHQNEGNAMRLVDDLLEPYRPIIDLRVWLLMRNGEQSVTPDSKRALVRTLFDDLPTSSGVTPVSVCIQRTAVSLAQVYLGERDTLDLPLPALPISLASGLERK